MSIRLHCDGPGCDNSTDPDNPDYWWVRTESITTMTTISYRRRESHYCSPECEYNHSYLLISGDNGK
jgi:hypothetical protein